MTSRQAKPLILAALLAVLAGYCGNFHFVYGNGVSMRKIAKVSWSLSETLINADEVKGTPPLYMRVKYPIFSQSLEAWAAEQ